MEGPTSKKTKEPPKRANHKGNIKFPNPLVSQEAQKKPFNMQLFSMHAWGKYVVHNLCMYGNKIASVL
jgi:hypothetical protein